jgi:hypothetical protein
MAILETKSRATGRVKAYVVLAILCLAGAGSAETAATSCDQALVRMIPARQGTDLSASDVVRRMDGLSETDREGFIAEQLLRGNVPAFLRRAAAVTLSGALASGRIVRITVCVLPDYLALGSDRDFLLVPLRLATALTVASFYGFVLPTRKIVDAIYQQAKVRLVPQPLPAADQMRSTGYYWRHNQAIQQQRASLGLPLGMLTAGHKKDLVITDRLWRNPERVAIYGWHQSSNKPIQPLSLVHGAQYADYSHGVRLVSTMAYVDGVAKPILEILEDPQLAPLLSDEGPIPHAAALLEALGARMRSPLAGFRAEHFAEKHGLAGVTDVGR